MTNPYQKSNSNNGFTLIELLLVISILAVLASLSLVVIADAQNDARTSATQALLSQIDEILKQRLEDYEVRRVPFRLTDYTGIFTDDNGDGIRGNNENTINREFLQEVKRRIIADVINAELPRKFEDVAFASSQNLNFPGSATLGRVGLRTWLENQISNDLLLYGGNIDSLIDLLTDLQSRPPVLATRFRVLGSDQAADYPDNSGEYLFKILQATDYEGTPAIDYLRGSAIGDTDNDGFFEVLDSWGNPLEFTIEMFDEAGNSIGDLDPGSPAGAPGVENLKLIIASSGDGAELITN